MIAIGVVIGFVMGLTGAGGALVAIPLFMQFQNMTLKEASVFSLIAVVIASLSNLFYQRRDARIKLASIFIIASALGSFISQPYKDLLPDLAIAVTLTLISFYSLYAVWVPSQKNDSSLLNTNLPKTIVIGLLLGILTTFTGLGGGVLMLPILLGIYKLEQKQAVATSLMVVGLSSLASFIIQVSKGVDFKINQDFIGLFAAILISSYLLKFLISKSSSRYSEISRKVVFTVVVILSLTKIFQA